MYVRTYINIFLLLACANASTGVRMFVCMCVCVHFRDTNCASKVVRDRNTYICLDKRFSHLLKCGQFFMRIFYVHAYVCR